MTAYIYSYILKSFYSGLPVSLPETFRIPSGTRASDGPADGGDFHCLRGC